MSAPDPVQQHRTSTGTRVRVAQCRTHHSTPGPASRRASPSGSRGYGSGRGGGSMDGRCALSGGGSRAHMRRARAAYSPHQQALTMASLRLWATAMAKAPPWAAGYVNLVTLPPLRQQNAGAQGTEGKATAQALQRHQQDMVNAQTIQKFLTYPEGGGGTNGGRPGQRVEEQGTWASQKHSEAGYGRPVDRGVWTAKTVKRPWQQPAHPQYANYWAPLTRKRYIPPHPAQPRHTNDWAPRTRKRHRQEHRPQRPTERSDPTQHAKGTTGDCPGPRKGTATRRNVTRGGGGLSRRMSLLCRRSSAASFRTGSGCARAGQPSRNGAEGLGQERPNRGGGISEGQSAGQRHMGPAFRCLPTRLTPHTHPNRRRRCISRRHIKAPLESSHCRGQAASTEQGHKWELPCARATGHRKRMSSLCPPSPPQMPWSPGLELFVSLRPLLLPLLVMLQCRPSCRPCLNWWRCLVWWFRALVCHPLANRMCQWRS